MTLGELPYKTHVLLARAGQRRLEGIGLLEHAVVHDARSARAGSAGGGGGVPGGVPTGTWWPRGPRRSAAELRRGRRAGGGAREPGRTANSCQEHGGSWQFMDQVVDTLRTYDTRWGYNGKRGNANDPSNGCGRRTTTARVPDEGLDAGLHHRHHRRALRRDPVAGLERRDRDHALIRARSDAGSAAADSRVRGCRGADVLTGCVAIAAKS